MQIIHMLYNIAPAPLRLLIKSLWLHFRRIFFWLPFFCSWVVGASRNILRPSRQPTSDLVFVLDRQDEKWILGASCREIAKRFPGKVQFYYGRFYRNWGKWVPFWPRPMRLPDAEAYFFADVRFLVRCLKANPPVWFRRKYVWYTHPEDLGPQNEVVFALNRATKVISMCSLFVNLLGREGVKREKLTCVPGAADPEFFRPHQRSSDGLIGFCTAFYPRKNPDLILELVKTLRHRNFTLLGRNWEQYAGFSELIGSPNFSYVDVPYSEYPRYYEKMSVFVSASALEGGPIPLIEAMMSNVVPVASRTGFAPDLIEHGQNGFLFAVESPAELVCEYVEKSFSVEKDIRASVERLSWTNFALEMNAVLAERQIGNNLAQSGAARIGRPKARKRQEA
jgi:glycosyltransferase involved in cell wall biosynthesis